MRETFAGESAFALLPKKTGNALNTALRRTELLGYDPSQDQEEIPLSRSYASDRAAQALVTHAGVLGIQPQQIHRPVVDYIETLLGTSNSIGKRRRGNAASIAVDDIGTIAQTALEVFNESNGNPRDAGFEDVVVRTVIGGSGSYPLRTLSYLLPALNYVDQMRAKMGLEIAKLPQIQFFIMEHAGTGINGFHAEDAARERGLLIHVGQQFIRQFFPDLEGLVHFSSDEAFIGNPQVRQLHELLMHNCDHLTPELQAEVDVLCASGNPDPLKYIALHPLVHDLQFETPLFTSQNLYMNTKPTTIIDMGSQSEKRFYRFRQHMVPLLLEQVSKLGVSQARTAQMFTDHRVPPYMYLTGEDPSLDVSLQAALNSPHYLREIFLRATQQDHNLLYRDHETINQAAGSAAQFVDFLKSLA